ncbi:hypothetical protein N2E09_08245 [Leuconostoc citreum]
MSERSGSVISMVKVLKNMDHIQSEMLGQLEVLNSQMNKLTAEYVNFNQLGHETNYKKVIDLIHELNSLEPINYGQNIKELRYEIETSRQDLIPYQSYLKKLV